MRDATNTRYVFVTLPWCPACGSTNLATIRTEPPAGDGSKTQRKRCVQCGYQPFFVIWEPPEP